MQKIINGDCISTIPSLPNKFDLIFCDSPYNIGIDYGNGKKADLLKDDDFAMWCATWMDACVEKLSDKGSMWVLINDEYAAIFDFLLSRGCRLFRRNWIILYESFGVQTTKKFARTKRHLLYYVKDEKNFTFNAGEVMVPSARLTKYKDNRANPKGKVDEDIWDMVRLCGTFKERIDGFPTQLPLDLLRRIIKVSTNEGDWVLDPFSGSGTTCCTAKELNRNAIGIEKSKEYFDKSTERLSKHDAKLP